MKNIEDLKTDLTKKHWLDVYNWAGLSIKKIADAYNCKPDDVRFAMAEIAQEHPKSKTRRASNEGTCRTCGAPIVWINKHPCNPKVINGIDGVGKVVKVRESHFSSCPQAKEHRKNVTGREK